LGSMKEKVAEPPPWDGKGELRSPFLQDDSPFGGQSAGSVPHCWALQGKVPAGARVKILPRPCRFKNNPSEAVLPSINRSIRATAITG